MKPGTTAASTAVLCALLLAEPAEGQVDVEVRGGVAVGSHTATAAGLDLAPRLSYEASVVVRVNPGVSVYGGFLRTGFGCEEGFCLDRDLTVVGNHAALGVELTHGSPWLRLGLLFGTTAVGTDGDAADTGLGAHGALGLSIGSGRVRFLPGLSYRRLSAGSEAGPEHATALTADLGVRIRLGSD